jgi:hypothetical protein
MHILEHRQSLFEQKNKNQPDKKDRSDAADEDKFFDDEFFELTH